MTLIIQGGVPVEALSLFSGASLPALGKKGGEVRPIAAGDTLRRLSAKIACRRVQKDMGEKFRPLQLGFGTKSGCEAIVPATRFFVEKPGSDNRVMAKLDFKNAFNFLLRSHIMKEIYKEMPGYALFFHRCYGKPSSLLFGDYTITSERGIQQGDPLGPFV